MKRLSFVLVILMSLLYATYFSWFTVTRHHKLNSSRFDLGNVEQTMWSTTHGNFMNMTNPYGEEPAKRMAFHADFFLLAVVPFYAAVPQTETLLVLQTVALASGGLAVWLIARRRLQSDWLAFILSGSYFLYPGLQWTNIFDVHAVAFAVPLMLWTMSTAQLKKYGWTLALVVLAMLTKEEMGFMLPAIGIYVWWRQREKKWGKILTLLPFVWAVVVTLVMIPAWQSFLDTKPPVFQSYFGETGPEIARNILLRPWKLISILASGISLTYVWQLVLPLGLLPLGGWWSLAAVPDVTINLMSTKPAQHLINSHYTAGIIPWLMLGTIWTVAWMRQRWQAIPWLSKAIGAWLIVTALVSAYLYGPLPGAKHDHSRFASWRNEYAQPVSEWTRRIPETAAVSVTNNIGSQFAKRDFLYSFPLGIEKADYLVVFENHGTAVIATQAEVSKKAGELRADPHWEVLEHSKDLTVLRKRRY